MNKYNLLSVVRKRKYYHYGQAMNKDFKTAMPNHRWAPDISCIRTNQGFLYL